MPWRFDDILRRLDEPEEAALLIETADTGETHAINKTQVASQLYLAYKAKIAGESVTGAMAVAGESLTAATADLAKAFREAAAASDKAAHRLVRATWALAIATGFLVVATGALALFAYLSLDR